MTTRLFFLTLFAIFVLSACGSEEAGNESASGQTEAPLAAAQGNNPLFDRVDADTPMLAANLATAPDEIIDHLWQSMEIMSEYSDPSSDEIADSVDDESPLLAALLEEISSIQDRESMEALGLHSNGYWAVHMISVYPVVHFELIDPAAFQAMLDRIAADSDTPLPKRQIGGEEIVWIESSGIGVAVHHDERFVTLAVVPDNDEMLRRAANLDRPEQAFQSDQLARFNQDQGFVRQGSGFIDLQAIFNRLMDTENSQAATARSILGLESLAGDPSCKTEMSAMLSIFPRAVAGLSALDMGRLDMKMVVEAESGMASRLSEIADTPVGLSGGEPRTFSAGIAFNLVAARDFGREVVSNWVESPPKCAAFSDVAENAADWQRALNQPIPPVVTNIRGLQVNIDDMVMGESGQVEDAAGTLALFVRNPEMLLGMAQMFSPELAAMGLEQNGEPKPLPAGLIPNMPDLGAFIALGNEAIGLSVGEGQQDNLSAALTSSGSDPAVFAYAINFEGYSKLMTSMMSRFGEMEGMPSDEMPPPDFMAPFAELYDTSSFAVELTDQGIVLKSNLTMKQ